ncbi:MULTISPECIES: hypothetical protein [Streptomyces]|uniref:Uncharacterized protein n=1 Tax=Streptomyces flavovirens TaxID=52258 RepID=A0ABV8NC97_9ACTN|nr:hypothetical protein [Streptomyces sp. MBT51]MBK3595773.1 hypothetical protein [Streptomyces sp. MBT51]
MNAYTRIYQGLVAGGVSPAEASAELAELRRDTGTELAAGVREYAREICQHLPGDSQGQRRLRARQYGAMQRTADWIALAVATGRLTTTPHQRTRSNP